MLRVETNSRKKQGFLFFTLWIGCAIFSGCEDQLFRDKSNDSVYIFDAFWQEVDRHYAFFDHVSIDWDSVYQAHRPQVRASTSSSDLFWIIDEVLSLLNDAHATIHAPMGTGGNSNYFSSYPENPIVAETTGPYFENYNDLNRMFGFGKIKNSSLAYLRIKTFEGDKNNFLQIDSILNELERCTGLIIDVRSNFGGQISNSEVVAGRFADSIRLAYEYRLRNGLKHSDFTAWYQVNLIPNSKKSWSQKRVALLTNRSSFSATEWFVLFMKLQPNVTSVGDTTGGGGGVPITRELPNGWILRVPNTQTKLTSGKIFQGTGIYPDVPVWITKDDEEKNIDTILEAAMLLF